MVPQTLNLCENLLSIKFIQDCVLSKIKKSSWGFTGWSLLASHETKYH